MDVNGFVNNVTNQYIVRPLGGLRSIGISGFIFDIEGDDEVNLDAEITDHYVEDNYAIQDHIALRPTRIVLRGYVAELTDLFPNSLLSVLTKVQSLSSIGGFLPTFTAQATKVYTQVAGVVSRVGQVVNQARNVFDLFGQKSTSANKQQNAYKFFQDMRESRTLCTVETPFQVFNNMAIENVRAIQKEPTKFISDFQITFKQIRVVATVKKNASSSGGLLKGAIAKATANGRINDMVQDLKHNGETAGQSIDALGNSINTGTLQSAFLNQQRNLF